MTRLINRLLSPFGVRLIRDRPVRDFHKLLVLKAAELGVETLLDVGANEGQFAQAVRKLGYRGAIVSFEPTSIAHVRLSRWASDDPDWTAAPRMALGSETGEVTVNLSANSVSSSILTPELALVETEQGIGIVGAETAPLRRLDDVVDTPGPFALKIDTQGFELAVLEGAPETLAQTAVVAVELSLAGGYVGGPRASVVMGFLEDAGFRPIALTPGFSDWARNETLEVDGVFVRRT